VPAVALHHQLTGPDGAPAVLFGGSLGATLEMWAPQVEALSERRRVVAFDHRGHGASPIADGPYTIDELGGDVLALMASLELERASFCGLSLGGMIGLWLAAHAPERVERVVLICTAAHLGPASVWHQRAAIVRRAGTPAVLADAVVQRWFTSPFAAARPDVIARYRAMVAATSAVGYAGCCEAIADFDMREQLAGIRAPTLVIAGAQDEATTPAHGRAIAAAIAGAELEVLDPAAHLASVERAAVVNALLERWLL
jgi:3-oxoadipate enol-lactonase